MAETGGGMLSEWKAELGRFGHRLIHAAEQEYDAAAAVLRERFGRSDPVIVQPYRGFATEESVWISGRVLEDEGVPIATEQDSVWQNLLAMYLRFESDEVPGASVTARLRDTSVDVVTDEEGYFHVWLEVPDDMELSSPWQEIEFVLETTKFDGLVRVPDPRATFGVISDIDDTIVQSRAANLLTLARSTLLGNVHSRLPFAGVDAFYRALEWGPGGPTAAVLHPFFYVSSSPWNLYDFLEEFFELHGLPAGPILLRDLGIDASKFIKSGHDHKLDKIERVLSAYPHLRFVLVGDSGQEDPELYREAVERFPERIRCIYIRHVADETRAGQIAALIEEVARHDIDMLLMEDTLVAARHAATSGMIDPEQLPAIIAAVEG